jgi:hypothetical protein
MRQGPPSRTVDKENLGSLRVSEDDKMLKALDGWHLWNCPFLHNRKLHTYAVFVRQTADSSINMPDPQSLIRVPQSK